jgi:gliding motility-associated-like protein
MVITRTWTATDSCGNATSADQVITIEDTTAPIIIDAPESEISVTCSSIPELVDIVVVDNCDSDVQVTFEETVTEVDAEGVYQIIRSWTMTDECSNTSMFTQAISVQPLVLEADNAINISSEAVPFDLNNFINGVSAAGGNWTDDDDSGALNGSIFDPFGLDLGDYKFTYSSTEEGCVVLYTIVISIEDDNPDDCIDCVVLACETPDGIEITRVVTANNDGLNDTFTVSDVSDCGFTPAVKIFNRWGKQVYESDNYKNNWGGYHDNSGPTIGSGNKLPAGTYYYIVNIIGSGFKPMTGYIYLGTN